jgi:hypothetical protein
VIKKTAENRFHYHEAATVLKADELYSSQMVSQEIERQIFEILILLCAPSLCAPTLIILDSSLEERNI